ncbi:ATPase [Ignisphaera aggregans DSM 17230]|uniref:ATPase n=1 Tax=Ignisphaera aggregans (strain DSM 17230 / JCM 13409 / AQ1.S1) TaxID=583356 RepID=E0STD3_IGNAA|nr:ATPase [Ignisphaera aggregans DSM 17230]
MFIVRRIKLRFADREIEFADREVALKQVEEFAERGTRFPVVVYGPEGCGKTAFFKQAKVVLEEYDYSVVYTNPLAHEEREILLYTPSIRDIVEEVFKSFPDPYSRIVDIAIRIASRVMRKLRKPRIAILMDDIFQAIGLDKAEIYTKILLNLIEYPSGDYEKIVVLVSSSEGVTRTRIGRHLWSVMYLMWNMSREGLKLLYDVVPDPKPLFEDVWRFTGGNPRIFEMLHSFSWNIDMVISMFIKERDIRGVMASLSSEEIEILRKALEDPDTIFRSLRNPATQKLEKLLIELNLIIDVWERDKFWIDTPPPEKDLELGIGEYYAWQTPLHREAVKRVLV